MQVGIRKQSGFNWKEWLILAVGLIMALRVGTNVVRLHKLGAQVVEAERQLDSAKLKNADLKQKLEQAQTPEYLEKEVRNRLGYAKEGETVIIIPKEELSTWGDLTSTDEAGLSNPLKWWKLYFGG